MSKREELSCATNIVKEIMIKDSKTRNSDALLYVEVIERLNKGVSTKPFAYVLGNAKNLGLPCYDTVTRIRRKLQETHPELWSDATIKKYREEAEKDFEDYARS